MHDFISSSVSTWSLRASVRAPKALLANLRLPRECWRCLETVSWALLGLSRAEALGVLGGFSMGP